MSNDQRPARIRAVTGSAAPTPAEAGNGGNGTTGDGTGSSAGAGSGAPHGAEQAAASGPSILAIMLFLIACGAGGGLVAALPHLVAQ